MAELMQCTEESAKDSGSLNRRKKIRARSFRLCMYVLMTLIGLILVFPYLFMISKSLMSRGEVTSAELVIIPAAPQFSNYLQVIQDSGYFAAFGNTMFVIIFNLIAVPLSATFIAFGFARCKFWGKNVLFGFMLSTMMLPAVVTQIPLYSLYNSLGWLNTLLPLTIPNITGGGAIYIFLARSFLQSLPKEIDDAAKIDGVGPLRRYFFIGLPLCKPIIIYIMINVFNSAWGDYYGPLIWRLNDDFPATLAYRVFYTLTNSMVSNDLINIRMAAGVLMSIVPAVLFFIFQKQLIEGVAMDGLKG